MSQPIYWQDRGGIRHDVTNPMAVVGVLDSLSQDLGRAITEIQTLQAAPTAPSTAQWQQLVNTIATGRTQPTFTAGNNPVLSTPGRNVLYTDYPPPAGSVDIKDFAKPEPFNGNRLDADHFIDRCLTYFAARPNAMRLAKTRILYACSRIDKYPAHYWAMQVSAAITKGENNDYYTDDWDTFAESFLKKFDIPNSKQHYFVQLIQLQQGSSLWEPFFAEFERLRKKADVQKTQGFWYLKQATNPRLRSRITLTVPAPDTYDDWCEAARLHTEQLIANQEASNYNPRPAQPRGQSFQYRQPSRSTFFQQQPPQQSRQPDVIPMDIDNLSHSIDGVQQRKQGHNKGKPVPRKVGAPGPDLRRPRDSRNAPANKKPIAGSSKDKVTPRTSPGSTLQCYRCGQYGHIMRNCSTALQEIREEHINALASHVEMLQFGGDQPQEEDSGEVEEDPYATLDYENPEEEEETPEEPAGDEQDF